MPDEAAPEPDDDEVPSEWRPTKVTVLFGLFPTLGPVLLILSQLNFVFVEFTVVGLVLTVVGLALLVICVVGGVGLVRTRVALTDAGLEVRQLRDRLITWGEIREATISRLHKGAITLRLRDGSVVGLPAPRAQLGDSSDPRVDQALRLIRARLVPED